MNARSRSMSMGWVLVWMILLCQMYYIEWVVQNLFYFEQQIKREVKGIHIGGCRCNERLQAKNWWIYLHHRICLLCIVMPCHDGNYNFLIHTGWCCLTPTFTVIPQKHDYFCLQLEYFCSVTCVLPFFERRNPTHKSSTQHCLTMLRLKLCGMTVTMTGGVFDICRVKPPRGEPGDRSGSGSVP